MNDDIAYNDGITQEGDAGMAVKEDVLKKCVQVVPGVYHTPGSQSYYIRCIQTGVLCYCIKPRLDKLITRFGSIEAVGLSYISKEGTAQLKPVKIEKVEQKRVVRMVEDSPVESRAEERVAVKTPLPKPSVKFPHAPSDVRVGSLLSESWTRCLRPDIFRERGGYCNGCAWFDLCKFNGREWKAYEEQPRRFEFLETFKDGLPVMTGLED